ncbi:MAG: HAD hydrolase family protein [Candidatus Omnitrophica bacterium]|jgi:3-deoxy-D-manno-octulosonate 8-phosphate phosphatase (KDO 8-P phosphatase)|nr:HAD hydrolase family protein [Candidatus Omnitrophota bacterium]
MNYNKTKNINALFKKVKLLVLDVDGVLTKGEIIYDDQGRELKIFNVKDGLGIFVLKKMGINTLLLTAKNSPVLRKRAKDMRVAEVIGGILPKESMLDKIKSKYKVKESEICFIGDDILDLGLIKKVGIGIAVKDATGIVKKSARYITSQKGGEGAVREVVDLILKAKKLDKRVDTFIQNPLIDS